MRNPNNYGSVFKLSGNRRKPWAVRVTTGWSKDYKQQYKYLGYYTTRKDAMQALAEYNANPYNIDESEITFGELHERWKNKHFKDLSANTIKSYNTAFNYCEPILNLKMKEIKTVHLQNFIDDLKKNHGTLMILKNVINQVFEYAMELDIIQKDYSEFISVGKRKVIKEKSVFTDAEIDLLWDNLQNFKYADTILIMIYTGMRIGELLSLMKQDVDLIDQTITVKESKTAAGRNRVIPIHPRIKELLQIRYEYSNIDNIISSATNKSHLEYSNYLRYFFAPVMKSHKMNHTPHDCRHTFATRLNDAGGNATAIKKMIGHESFTLTEKVYTHKKIDELRKALELVN